MPRDGIYLPRRCAEGLLCPHAHFGDFILIGVGLLCLVCYKGFLRPQLWANRGTVPTLSFFFTCLSWGIGRLRFTLPMQVELNRETILEASRFVIVGVIATALHYGIYWILMRWVNVNIAYTIGYALSFVCNFFLTSYFTFKAKATMKRGLGFGSAHLVNYLLQMAFLNLFIWLGIMAEWAPIPVYMIVIPINFLLVRFVFKKI